MLRVLNQPDPVRASRAQQAARRYDWSQVGATVLAVYRAALSAAPVPSAANDRMNAESHGLVVILALILGGGSPGWLPGSIGRTRAERTWAALDAALVRRAQRALELIADSWRRPRHGAAASRMRRPRLWSQTSLGVIGNALRAISATCWTRSVPMLPAQPETRWTRSEREPASVADCTTMRWPPPCHAPPLQRTNASDLAGGAAEPRPFEMAESDVHSDW